MHQSAVAAAAVCQQVEHVSKQVGEVAQPVMIWNEEAIIARWRMS